jgi:hypothetical protein
MKDGIFFPLFLSNETGTGTYENSENYWVVFPYIFGYPQSAGIT